MTGQSESLPITTPTSGPLLSLTLSLAVLTDFVGRPFPDLAVRFTVISFVEQAQVIQIVCEKRIEPQDERDFKYSRREPSSVPRAWLILERDRRLEKLC